MKKYILWSMGNPIPELTLTPLLAESTKGKLRLCACEARG
jgi:hypothetical protein